MPARSTDGRFEIVVICSGNRFRSPLVAAYLREATRALPVDVSSAGILDLEPMPALEGAVEAAHEIGLDLTQHRSQYVGTVRLEHADLVLGFERAHVTTAVIDGKAARERTFTLPELVWLLERVPPVVTSDSIAGARRAIADAHRLRDPSAGAGLRQIDDPIGAPARAQQDTARQLIELSSQLALALFGQQVAPALPPLPPERTRSWAGLLRRRG